MAVKDTVQLNVRVTPDVIARLDRVAELARQALGLQAASKPDLIEMGLALLEEWLQVQAGQRAESVASLTGENLSAPEVEPTPQKPRPRLRKA